MKKLRISSLFIVLALTCMMSLSTVAFAAGPVPYSSPTLLSYAAWAKTGRDPGVVRITYDVTANTIADSLGVSSIQICNANGLPIQMASGSVLNGMIIEDSVNHQGTYLYSGNPGSTYYAVVTVFATIDGVTDSRTISTTKVAAPTSSTP